MTFQLATGAKMPTFGFGTWQSDPGIVGEAVAQAIEGGYRHLDFAKCYENQREVGTGIKEGLKRANIRREELFLVSKLWNSQHRPSDVASALDDTLNELGLSYLDIYLMHFPVAFKSQNPNTELFPLVPHSNPPLTLIDHDISIVDTWKAMLELPKTKARSVGVSNFSIEMLEAIIEATGEKPVCNQVERHPKLQDQALLDYCQKKGIAIVSYSPLGNNQEDLPLLTEHPIIREVAKECDATPGQVLIAWGLQQNCTVIAKTVTPSRIKENLQHVKLSTSQVTKINGIGKEPARFNVPYVVNKPKWPINIFNTDKERSQPGVVLGVA